MRGSIQERVSYWLNGPFDPATKKQVEELTHHPRALADAFFTDLSFGTGGLRAPMGVGPNRLNIYTIRKLSQGVANYLKKQSPSPSVVIAFDSRHHSRSFAKEAACTLAGNGIVVHFIPELRPTPYLSFACQEKKATAGIMITASHNPKEYNGYKVYREDGAQVIFPEENEIFQEIEKIVDFSTILLAPFTTPLIHSVSLHDLDQAYLQKIAPLARKQTGKETLQIVYTSFHGTGITMIPAALRSFGFSSIHLVEEEVQVDGDFPSVPSPNPEDPDSMRRALALLAKINGDLAIASDPDADRIGVGVLHQGKPLLLSGNEIAAIATYFLVSQPHPPASAIITTIVTTELLQPICKKAGVLLVEVLTGFKYIGAKIREWEEKQGSPYFLFGAEESYGYLLGFHARDKDGIITSCLLAEITLFAKKQGKTLIDLLYELYREHGVFREKQLSLHFTSEKEGASSIKQGMDKLRSAPPHFLGGIKIVSIEDYKQGIRILLPEGKKEKLLLPHSDVLVLRLEDHSRIVIRPSGTEPKLKIYAGVQEQRERDIHKAILLCDQKLSFLLQQIQSLFLIS